MWNIGSRSSAILCLLKHRLRSFQVLIQSTRLIIQNKLLQYCQRYAPHIKCWLTYVYRFLNKFATSLFIHKMFKYLWYHIKTIFYKNSNPQNKQNRIKSYLSLFYDAMHKRINILGLVTGSIKQVFFSYKTLHKIINAQNSHCKNVNKIYKDDGTYSNCSY